MSAAEQPSTTPDPKRWLALVVIAIAQLMIVLDASIVNIALPSAQKDLGISDADRQWVVTAYTLTFGGFLLLGGRIADYMGRKRTFIVGLFGFAAASALGGIASTAGLLYAARGLQGTFAALMAPAALSLISVTFTEATERAKAFGVYGAVSGGGAAIGLHPRRHPDRVRVVALVPRCQRADRPGHRRGGVALRQGEQGDTATPSTTSLERSW